MQIGTERDNSMNQCNIFKSLFPIISQMVITDRKRSCWKIMFSWCLSVHRGDGYLWPCSFWGVGISGTRSFGEGMFSRWWLCPWGGYVQGVMSRGRVLDYVKAVDISPWELICLRGLVLIPSQIHGTWDTTGYDQQAGGTHPTGMLSCLQFYGIS